MHMKVRTKLIFQNKLKLLNKHCQKLKIKIAKRLLIKAKCRKKK